MSLADTSRPTCLAWRRCTFGLTVLKHRHTLGFEDITPWAVRVTSEVGRVLLVCRSVRLRSSAQLGSNR